MNGLLYNARMALRDLIEIDIVTRGGSDQVYLSLTPGLDEESLDTLFTTIVDRLGDMGMILAGGENATTAFRESGSVEVLRKAA